MHTLNHPTLTLNHLDFGNHGKRHSRLFAGLAWQVRLPLASNVDDYDIPFFPFSFVASNVLLFAEVSTSFLFDHRSFSSQVFLAFITKQESLRARPTDTDDDYSATESTAGLDRAYMREVKWTIQLWAAALLSLQDVDKPIPHFVFCWSFLSLTTPYANSKNCVSSC